MVSSHGRRCGARVRCLALLLLLAASTAGRLDAQAVPVQTGVELSTSTQQALARLQEQWLQWVSAFYQNDPARARAAVDDVLGVARQLGMSRLPDLALAALVRAVESARGGNFERAGWALEAASKLDGGRPEEAFAQASVARLQGSYFRSVMRYAEGWRRLGSVPLLRQVGLMSLALWACGALLAAAAFFLVLQVATKGGALWQEASSMLAAKMPRRVAQALTLVLLLWPLALPKGLLWLALYWSALLWSYGSRSERLVFVLAWLAMAVVPGIAATQQPRILAELSPPGRALGEFAQGRLTGGLFTDFGVLRSMLPQSVAAKQVTADLHRTLGQWELARTAYLEVVDIEPQNPTALVNLGNYFFRKGDFGKAVEYYRSASAVAPQDPAPLYNLSQAFSESYLFEESRRALDNARAIDERRVSQWVKESRPERVLSFDGGLARSREILQELTDAGEPEAAQEAQRPAPLWFLALPAVLTALLALVLWWVRHRWSRPIEVDGEAPRWLRVLVPGLSAVERGAGFSAFLALLCLSALLLLLLGGGPRLPIPWGFDPGRGLVWLTAVLGFGLLYGLRARRELRAEE